MVVKPEGEDKSQFDDGDEHTRAKHKRSIYDFAKNACMSVCVCVFGC